MNHDPVKSGFTNVTREVKDKTFDPRVARGEAAREQSVTLMGKMAERAKFEAEMFKDRGDFGAEEAAAEQVELEKLRAQRLQEMREEGNSQAGPGEHATVSEEQFAKRLMEQHQSGAGVTVAHFPESGSECSTWIDAHLKRRAAKYRDSTFVTVPEQAAANMPFIEEVPAVVCFDGNEIGGVLERPERFVDEDDFCVDVDRWLAMMHHEEWA